jgi:hypothetical protein
MGACGLNLKLLGEDIVDRLKNDVDLQGWFERRAGVVFRSVAGKLTGKCCFHDDTQASLVIYPTDNHFHCFGCGKHGTIIDAAQELWPDLDGDFSRTVQTLAADELGIYGDEERPKPARKLKVMKKTVAQKPDPVVKTLEQIEKGRGFIRHHTYHGPDGEAAYLKALIHVDAKDPSLGKRAVFYIPEPDGRWHISQDEIGAIRTLYNLADLQKPGLVWYVEGEKDVETARKMGLVAVTAGSTNDFREEMGACFAGRDVAIIPDHDEAGEKSVAERVLPAILAHARSVRVVRLPVGGRGEDLTDWVERYDGTVEELQALYESNPIVVRALNEAPNVVEVLKASPEHEKEAAIDAAERLIAKRSEASPAILQDQTGLAYTPSIPRNYLITPGKGGRERLIWTYRDGRKKHPVPVEIPLCEPVAIVSKLRREGDEHTQRYVVRTSRGRETDISTNLADKTEFIKRVCSFIEIPITPVKVDPLMNFFSDFFSYNEAKIPVEIAKAATGWDENFEKFYLPSRDLVGFRCADANLERKFKKVGTIAAETDLVTGLLQTPAGLVISVALAAPLIGPLHLPSFAFMVSGDSGQGKTAACSAAVSVFGDPDGGKLRFSWDSTAAGQEMQIRALRDLVFWPDDKASNVEKNREMESRKVTTAIMNFVNGVGRVRATKQVTAREISEYRGILLISSEADLSSIMAIAGATDKGAFRRTLELQHPALLTRWTDGYTYTPSEIYKAVSKAHGHLGAKWIEWIEKLGAPELRRRFEALTEPGGSLHGNLSDLEPHYAVCWFVSELVEEFLELPKGRLALQRSQIASSHKVYTATFAAIKDDVGNWFTALDEFIAKHYKKFIRDREASVSADAVMGADTDTEVFLFPKAMREICIGAQVDETRILKKLAAAGLIAKDAKAGYTAPHRLAKGWLPKRCYRIKRRPVEESLVYSYGDGEADFEHE